MPPGPAPTPGPMPVPGPGQTPTLVMTPSTCPEVQMQYMMTPRSTMSITHTKGLLNMPGQNNCFLNSAVQVLWHLDIFRRSFRELSGHMCMAESCIFCALKELFAQFQYSQESALPPDALRRALAETFFDQRRFQLGFMDDAAECFENILLRIHFHIANQESEDMCNSSHCIPHQKFAMTLVEQTVCHVCGATSEPLPFTQMVHYVSASALCSQAKAVKYKGDNTQAFGELLRRAGGMGDIRDCPSACGAKIQIKRNLMNRPEIVSVGIVWDSERPTLEHIMDVFQTIGLTVKLQDVFHSVVYRQWADSATHKLVGIVTYYGKHYSTFFFHTKLCVWIYFDDATVREIGPRWEQVVEKCRRGHFQPLLLLYSNPYGTPITTSSAPCNVTMAPDHKKNHSDKKRHESCVAEKTIQSSHLHPTTQRRAVTPNPEVSHDSSINIQPRRAVTPSGELARHEELKECPINYRLHSGQINGSFSGTMADTRNVHSSYLSQPYPKHCIFHSSSSCNPKSCFFYRYLPSYSFYNGHSNNEHYKMDSHKSVGGCQNVQTSSKMDTSSVQSTSVNNAQYSKMKLLDAQNTCTAKYHLPPRPASVDDLLQSISRYSEAAGTVENQNQFCKKNRVQEQDITTSSSSNTDDTKILNEDGDVDNDSTYISRKAVENVLHLQKLERQKSIKCKHSHPPLGKRTSSSSLESLENALMTREKTLKNPLGLKIEIPDAANIPRRRDSGNWSGDRNSASSSSSTSLDNPYYFVLGSKRPHPILNGIRCPSAVGKPCHGDYTAVFSDQGYDSFSLSSTDSYPSGINNSPVKLDPRLSLIPENVQTAFIPDSTTHFPGISKETCFSNGVRDECEKLCAEADIFLAKSVEREKHGDLAMAALLSDTAAAKARAAMDAPYSNSQTLVTAKMKHSMCVIRSSNLHRKLKEAENAEIKKQKEFSSEHHHLSRDLSYCKQAPQGNIDCYLRTAVNDNNHTKSDIYEKVGKNIEIYATLPKKGLRRKGNVISLMGTVSSSNSENKDFSNKQQNSQQESSDMGYVVNTASSINNSNMSASLHKISDDKNTPKGAGTKKKDSTSKMGNRDNDLSDFSNNEWEHIKKSSLCRTYSGPPTIKDKELGELTKESLNQTFSAHPSKKQHKIRRKLMGGFMRRKNRSLPDLREGNDPQNTLSCAFDDSAILQVPSSPRNKERLLAKVDCSEENKVAQSYFQNENSSNDSYQKEILRSSNSLQIGFQKNQSHLIQNHSSVKLPSSLTSDAATRSETPPPYKPPPPITSTFSDGEALCQRSSGKNLMTIKSNRHKENDSLPSNILSEPQEKYQHRFELLSYSPQEHIAKILPSTKLFESPTPSGKGSTTWLQELQTKQLLMLQRRKLQQQSDRQISDDHLDSSIGASAEVTNSMQRSNSESHNQLNVVIDSTCSSSRFINPTSTGSVDNNDQNQSKHLNYIDQNPTEAENDHKPQSVKDLASKFEQILKQPNAIEPTSSGSLSSSLHSSVGKTMDDLSSTYDSVQFPHSSDIVFETSQGHSDRENSEPISASYLSDALPADPFACGYYSFMQPQYHNQSAGIVHLPSLKNNYDGRVRQSQSVLNYHLQNDINVRNVPHQTFASTLVGKSELKRPDKPPDYETAIQRLGLIRGDRANHLPVVSGTHCAKTLEIVASPLFFDAAKKKRGPKKSVTFSDKVVLVACADEEENDFFPNPLLERVYRQHLQQRCSDDRTETKESESAAQKNLQSGCCNQLTGQHIDTFSQCSSAAIQIPCHLCHKKSVVPPTVYCPDCAFYMSRFKLQH